MRPLVPAVLVAAGLSCGGPEDTTGGAGAGGVANVDASADRNSGDATPSEAPMLSEGSASDAPGAGEFDGGDIYMAILDAGYRGCVVASMACADYPAGSCYQSEFVPLVDEQRSKGGPC